MIVTLEMDTITKKSLVLRKNNLQCNNIKVSYSESILNKSENATPELFAIYLQNYENKECK